MADLTIIILTKNEASNISECIKSTKGLAKRIVVVDSFSSDATIQIAKELGADIYQHEFVHYGAQFQYALDNCNIDTQWVFRLDADERITDAGIKEIEELCLINSDTDINGFVFRLQNYFLGKPIRHGVLSILEKLCIFKFGKAYMENRYMGEHIILTEGKSIKLKQLGIHYGVPDINFMINKLNWYASREAIDYYYQKNSKQELHSLDAPTRMRRFIKYKIYYHLPSELRCWMVFLYWYTFRLGFLDGKEGFYWNFFQTYFYRTLVDSKIYEKEKKQHKD